MGADESFSITFNSTGNAEEDELMITSVAEQMENAALRKIIAAFSNGGISSSYTTDLTTSTELTMKSINELAEGIQSDLRKVTDMNGIIRRFIITDDIIGKVYEALESNLNTDYKLSYERYTEHRNKKKKLGEVQQMIKDFNSEIRLEQLIRDCIPLTYAEGNYIMYLRRVGDAYSVDYFPLGIAYISDYTCAGRPVVCINMTELKSRLRKTYTKDKKNKPLFFKDIEEDIKNNYPDEVYTAYKNGESIAKLDPERTGVLRICNMRRKYGVSPISRALKSALMLENIEGSDFINNKARAKKIIHQILRKEVMGSTYEKKGLADAVYAHGELMKAWKNDTVVYTSSPAVEKIVYVEPGVEDTAADKVNLYRSKIMTTLGIGFIDANTSNFSVANISLNQLMKTINAISEQLEEIIERFYEIYLRDNNIDLAYMPSIQIIDAEQLSLEMKKSLVELMYSKLNCSLESSLDVLGISIEDEKLKREQENKEGIDKIFFPRKTAYTAGSDDDTGRPADSDDLDKQAYDKNREDSI